MSVKTKVTKSVYENAKGIVEQKGKWANAAAKNADPSIYEEAAKPQYKYLEENGASDVAEKLHGYDYSEAVDYLNTLEPESDTSSAFNGMISAVKEKSDVVFETAKKDKDTLASDYDKYVSYVKEGYSGKDYAKTIQDSYKEMGEKASLGVLAAEGGENSGNIDSYAKAQAQRQKLAYANAGNAAALDQYNSIVQNYLSGIEGKTAAITGMIDRLQENVAIDSSYYADMYNAMRSANLAEKQAYYEDLDNSREAENEKLQAEYEYNSSMREAAVDIIKAVSALAKAQMEVKGKVDSKLMDIISSASRKGTSTGNTVTDTPLRDSEILGNTYPGDSTENGTAESGVSDSGDGTELSSIELSYSEALQKVKEKAIGERESYINTLVNEGFISDDDAAELYLETVEPYSTTRRGQSGISLNNADDRAALTADATGIPVAFH